MGGQALGVRGVPRHRRRSSPEAALHHAGDLAAAGRMAMLQPHLASVDAAGEMAMLFLGGAVSHAVRE